MSGPVYQNPGTAIFSGTGSPGEVIYIDKNGAYDNLSGSVGSDGTFVITGPSGGILAGDILSAAAGSSSGPASPALNAIAVPAGPLATTMSAIDGGATVITVNGIPGTVVTVVDPSSKDVLGSTVIGSNGEGAVNLLTALPTSHTVDIVSGGILQGIVTSSSAMGQAPVVTQGSVIAEGSTLQGTGQAGSVVQAVDSNGKVLGTAVVNAQGTFTLPVSNASPGDNVSVIQNGVKAGAGLIAFTMGSEHAFTSANVFNPSQGGKLDISFKSDNNDHVTVRIFNVAGSLVRPLLEMDVLQGVLYAASWDGKNGDGTMVASGLYIISVHGSGVHTLRKVVVLK